MADLTAAYIENQVIDFDWKYSSALRSISFHFFLNGMYMCILCFLLLSIIQQNMSNLLQCCWKQAYRIQFCCPYCSMLSTISFNINVSMFHNSWLWIMSTAKHFSILYCMLYFMFCNRCLINSKECFHFNRMPHRKLSNKFWISKFRYFSVISTFGPRQKVELQPTLLFWYANWPGEY